MPGRRKLCKPPLAPPERSSRLTCVITLGLAFLRRPGQVYTIRGPESSASHLPAPRPPSRAHSAGPSGVPPAHPGSARRSPRSPRQVHGWALAPLCAAVPRGRPSLGPASPSPQRGVVFPAPPADLSCPTRSLRSRSLLLALLSRSRRLASHSPRRREARGGAGPAGAESGAQRPPALR